MPGPWVYPYLGGATDAVVQEANATRIAGISPGTDRCGDRTLRFAVSALFDNGIFLSAALQKIEDGTFREGQQIFLQVGRDKDVGAKICDATPAEQKTLDDLAARIAAKQVDVAAEIRKLG